MKAIADTGFLVALANRHDRYHSWAVKLSERITEPLLTCEAVLAETAFHTANVELPLKMVLQQLVEPRFDVKAEARRLFELAEQYRDRTPDLADLCLIRMSEVHPKHSVITVDVSDFRVYRRNRRDIIPLIHPPGL
jgi:predicted nucleic acid-binding protein